MARSPVPAVQLHKWHSGSHHRANRCTARQPPAWEYTLGGYQVLKKWLSYRETAVLGRPLKPEEAREFMHIAQRIAGLLALNPALDENYRAVVR